MDVVNDYSEDFADPTATYYRHEEAMGWRLPLDANSEETQRRFICRIVSADTTNHSGQIQYKDANTEVMGWVIERASARPLRAHLADIVDAAGLEGALYITTDREGVPTLSGGACLRARDLARYFALFVRRGRGVEGQEVGSQSFIERTLLSGLPMPQPNERMRYSNHMRVVGSSLGHSGWGGQLAMANIKTGTIGVFLSVIENHYAVDRDYSARVAQLLESVVDRDPEGSS
jgi:CubicO group peptidase (beta-lactamase class C family)